MTSSPTWAALKCDHPPGDRGRARGHPCVLGEVLAHILPLVEREYRRDLREVPPDLRKVLDEMDKKGRTTCLLSCRNVALPFPLGEKPFPGHQNRRTKKR